MLYHLFYNFLYQMAGDYPFLKIFGVTKYVTFRVGCAIVTSLLIALLTGPGIIRFIKSWQKDGQPIREDGPESHKTTKKGTPNMGGLIIFASMLISVLLWADLKNPYLWIALLSTLSYSAIGFYDDYLKIKNKNAYNNFSGKLRLFLQFTVAAIAFHIYKIIVGNDLATTLYFPIFKNLTLDLHWLYYLFAGIVMSGSANGVNFTDGLDGLCAGPTMIASGFFIIIAYSTGHYGFAEYLNIPCIAGSSELAIFMAALFGGILGFLWFNAPPAEIFMGDLGSLGIGGALGITSIITKHEIVYAIVGGIFVIEVLSDIIQVGSYKLRHKRVFLMAPIHHHFEKKGLSETKIVIRFWIVSLIFGLLGLATLKIR